MARSSTNNNGDFDADFNVPFSIPGPHTVTATDGINSDSATFTVTPSFNPVIEINPRTGPVGTPLLFQVSVLTLVLLLPYLLKESL